MSLSEVCHISVAFGVIKVLVRRKWSTLRYLNRFGGTLNSSIIFQQYYLHFFVFASTQRILVRFYVSEFYLLGLL